MNEEDRLNAESHFAFGKNWLDYSRKIDEERIAQAIKDLKRLSGLDSFNDLSFLDIGCGSGLHSLAAVGMGAVRVVGVDIDSDSVAAARSTLERFAPDAEASFSVASVFEMTPEVYGALDIVYSWGVLHHAGDMYRALSAAASLVGQDGRLMVALYRKTPFCTMWRAIKHWYSSASPSKQFRARKIYVGLVRLTQTMTGRDFDAYVRDYPKKRGMDYYNDVHDWKGGFPYQSISSEECLSYFPEQGFKVDRKSVQSPRKRLFGVLGSGCDEYTFLRGC